MTGGFALLMVLSMIINESLVAPTFGTYALQVFDVGKDSNWVPILGVALIAASFAVNAATNKLISRISLVSAALKVGGILIFAFATLTTAGFSFQPAAGNGNNSGAMGGIIGYVAAVALGILAYKGFTTITNSGGELKNPEKNVGRAIIISLTVCVIVYLLVPWAVGSTLSIKDIVAAKDYALAEASRPAFGNFGMWFTVAAPLLRPHPGYWQVTLPFPGCWR